MRRTFILLSLLALIALSAPSADARGRRKQEPGPNDIVYVIGGRMSNTYHPHFCSRCKRHQRTARAVRYWWAKDRGLRRHQGCAPYRR